MVHAALLLLMLEAANADLVFTISLKRSTQNFSAIHKVDGRLPHLLGKSDVRADRRKGQSLTLLGLPHLLHRSLKL
jgi:hypothetical protein